MAEPGSSSVAAGTPHPKLSSSANTMLASTVQGLLQAWKASHKLDSYALVEVTAFKGQVSPSINALAGDSACIKRISSALYVEALQAAREANSRDESQGDSLDGSRPLCPQRSHPLLQLHVDLAVAVVSTPWWPAPPSHPDNTSAEREHMRNSMAVALSAEYLAGVSQTLRPVAIVAVHPLAALSSQGPRVTDDDALASFMSRYRLQEGCVFSSALLDPEHKLPASAMVAALYTARAVNEQQSAGSGDDMYDSRLKLMPHADDGSPPKVLVPGGLNVLHIDWDQWRGASFEAGAGVMIPGLLQPEFESLAELALFGGVQAKQEPFGRGLARGSVVATLDTLSSIAYVQCMRQHFGRDGIFGGLPPLCDEQHSSDGAFQAACILHMALHGPARLLPACATPAGSMWVALLGHRGFEQDLRKLAALHAAGQMRGGCTGLPDIFSEALAWLASGGRSEPALAGPMSAWFSGYFQRLREGAFTSEA